MQVNSVHLKYTNKVHTNKTYIQVYIRVYSVTEKKLDTDALEVYNKVVHYQHRTRRRRKSIVQWLLYNTNEILCKNLKAQR